LVNALAGLTDCKRESTVMHDVPFTMRAPEPAPAVTPWGAGWGGAASGEPGPL